MQKALTILLTVLLGSYAVIVLYFYSIQDQMLYLPKRDLRGTPEQVGLEYEPVRIVTKDQEQIAGWFIPGGDKTVLFLHGNGDNISGRLSHAKLWHDLGFSILLIDYRGYGESTGEPIEVGLYADGLAAWDYLTKERGIPAERIVVVGESLGGGVATWLSSHRPNAALVLDATFTSVPDVAAYQYPWLPARILSRNHYRSIDRINQIQTPVLILHSRDDRLIPFEQGQKLFERANQPKTFVELKGPHASGLSADPETYRAAIESFVATLALP
jgi:Dipeptidyl aminopeptidases/acylaminoacyl-peptidases